MKTEILYGIHPVFEALKSGRRLFSAIYTARGKRPGRLKDIEKIANNLKISLEKVQPARLKTLSGTDNHQGVCARVSRYSFIELADFIEKSETTEGNLLLLVLDNMLDPNNLGALIRTALCAGINGIIIPGDRSATPTPAVSKASAGALEHVRLARVTNLVATIKELKKKGIWVIGADNSAGLSVFSSDLSVPLAIVIGGEGKGIRPLVKKHCDYLVSIPQTIQINSLNASAAGAIVMYEALRQRQIDAFQ